MAMEGLKVKAITMLMMVMLTQLSLAVNVPLEKNVKPKGFTICYPICLAVCLANHKNFFACAAKCTRKCIFSATDLSPNDEINNMSPLTANQYCKLGCSLEHCVDGYSQDVIKMGSCVNHCSNDLCSEKN